ncbi:hypothetical protein CDD81_6202 [Ophiocordyceps australis]|uniref:Uncharacterized protein n=1 Tax=Ophiocordyceps australis TaxID=1399860 RepID=A0A2C5Y8E2_9HYPO|nr:hypothetical protein CDD81_6202 [Ophiocordyceps australis]
MSTQDQQLREDMRTHQQQLRETACDLKNAVQDRAAGVRSMAQESFDRVVPPTSRRRAYDYSSALASQRPILFSFILSQLVFCFLPLLLFAAFAASTVVLALGAAVVFSLFWIGLALLVLVPVLLVASSVALIVWVWAVASFLLARWLYAHAPVGVSGGLQVDAAGRKFNVVKDERGIDSNIVHKS